MFVYCFVCQEILCVDISSASVFKISPGIVNVLKCYVKNVTNVLYLYIVNNIAACCGMKLVVL